MRLKFILCFLLACITTAKAQYSIEGSGQGKNGAYRVKVTTMVKDVKKGKDALMRNAVHGVVFRGFVYNEEEGTNQKPLVSDPNVENTKSSFFRAFFNEKAYERYASIVSTSFSSVKVKGGYEVSALLLVDKESLQHYLEENGIIQGFSNLW